MSEALTVTVLKALDELPIVPSTAPVWEKATVVTPSTIYLTIIKSAGEDSNPFVA